VKKIELGGGGNNDWLLCMCLEARGSLVVLQDGRSRVRDPMRYIVSIYLIVPAALGPGVHSASNRNEYQKQKINFFPGSRERPVRRAGNLTAICEPTV
jgi:hypothetical protein